MKTKRSLKKSCASCVNCRSTLGLNPRLYCSLQSMSLPLPKRICTCYNVAFVDGFCIPKK